MPQNCWEQKAMTRDEVGKVGKSQIPKDPRHYVQSLNYTGGASWKDFKSHHDE